MAKSKHRKNHKERVQARKNRQENQMRYINNLTNQLKEAMASANPETPMQLIPSDKLTLTGQNNDENYDTV
jgi:hypothetical protein